MMKSKESLCRGRLQASRYVDNQIQVIAAKQYDRPMQTDMIDLIVELLRVRPLSRIFIDSRAAGLIQELKFKVNDWDQRTYAQDDRYIEDINQRYHLESRPFVPRRNRTTKPFMKAIDANTPLEDVGKKDGERFRGSSNQALYHDMIRHQQEMKEAQRSHMPDTTNELSHESDIEKDRLYERRRKGLE
jgi:hypothetical protein